MIPRNSDMEGRVFLVTVALAFAAIVGSLVVTALLWVSRHA